MQGGGNLRFLVVAGGSSGVLGVIGPRFSIGCCGWWCRRGWEGSGLGAFFGEDWEVRDGFFQGEAFLFPFPFGVGGFLSSMMAGLREVVSDASPSLDFQAALGSKSPNHGVKTFDNNLFAPDSGVAGAGVSNASQISKFNGCLEREAEIGNFA